MNSTPRIGVVIPAFQDAEGLRRTLQAFQELPVKLRDSLEIAVVDGGSSDGTLSVVSEFMSLLTHVDSQADQGVYDAMNRGARQIQSPFVWFMGAGDVPQAPGLSKLLFRLNDHDEDAHACSVDAMSPREPGVPKQFVPHYDQSILWRNTIHHQGLVAPTNWIKQKPFSTDYKVLSDYAWILDQRNDGNRIHCHADLVLASVSSGGLSRQFGTNLYKEERRMKLGRVSNAVLLAHTFWLPCKWAFKQISKALSI